MFVLQKVLKSEGERGREAEKKGEQTKEKKSRGLSLDFDPVTLTDAIGRLEDKLGQGLLF